MYRIIRTYWVTDSTGMLIEKEHPLKLYADSQLRQANDRTDTLNTKAELDGRDDLYTVKRVIPEKEII